MGRARRLAPACDLLDEPVGNAPPASSSPIRCGWQPTQTTETRAKHAKTRSAARVGPVGLELASAGLDVLVEAAEVGLVVRSLESCEPLVVALPVGRAHAVLALVAEEVEVDAPARVGLHRVEEVACPGDVAFGLGIVLGPDRVDVDVVGAVPLTVR